MPSQIALYRWMLGCAACLGQVGLWKLSIRQCADYKDSVSIGESVIRQLREPRVLLSAFLRLTRRSLLLHGICIKMLRLKLWITGWQVGLYSLPLSVREPMAGTFLHFCSNDGGAGMSGGHSRAM